MKTPKPRRPHGRWTYYIMYEDILWPCPVRWEWENGYGGWLPFYYSPTLEFVAGDPLKATKVPASKTRAAVKTLKTPQYEY
ncbi:hypothetical protein [Rahnella sp. R3(2024)]|uniref:hypothetical protein n=1 Tax=Rahnella TaxID=34037 RepID=UPI0010A524E9|nr:hypothetical protein ERD95_04285 [Enterobacteriaceae bacterium ML5]